MSKEVVDGLNVFLLQAGKFLQNLSLMPDARYAMRS